jgi:3-phosphoinositide dependent protein kinase-1
VEFFHLQFSDIKPENILIDSNLVPIIADYWNSVQFDSIENGTAGSFTDLFWTFSDAKGRRLVLSGTPEYMAPEQVASNLLCFGSDIWAFGCTLYYMKSSKYVFHFSLSTPLLLLYSIPFYLLLIH